MMTFVSQLVLLNYKYYLLLLCNKISFLDIIENKLHLNYMKNYLSRETLHSSYVFLIYIWGMPNKSSPSIPTDLCFLFYFIQRLLILWGICIVIYYL